MEQQVTQSVPEYLRSSIYGDVVQLPEPIDLPDSPQAPPSDVLVVLLPLLIVLSTLLFLLLLFLVSILLLRRRRGISLRDHDGPIDMSREDLVEGEGGFEGVESRWLESVPEPTRREYLRAKQYQIQYPPNSMPTDITLSQFLSIQEKGVSAWSFEPDYEAVNSLLVHARTEITFLPDPASSSCVQSNLPLPKLNEVYYWEVKMFDLPETTTVSVGLSTKPYPAFRLPGINRFSIAYHSNGDKSFNYPFTATTYGSVLKEGDVIGIGYRPRSGTVFFTRNGRKLEDAFTGLSRYNLFPTIGADGPCSVHVNLGQSGFVFIEANVKKWGLAPSVGTLAPPPAYGSERGSILLDVGGGIRDSANRSPQGTPGSSTPSSPPHRASTRSRRSRNPTSSPLRVSSIPPSAPLTPPPPITPIDEESPNDASFGGYISPTDRPFHAGNSNFPASPGDPSLSGTSSPSGSNSRPSSPETGANLFSTPRHHRHSSLTDAVAALSELGSTSRTTPAQALTVQVAQSPPPESPRTPNPPTPNQRDIHLQALPPSFSSREHRRNQSNGSVSQDDIPIDRLSSTGLSRRTTGATDPPAYSPLDAYTYSDGVHIDLPAEVIAAALEGRSTSPAASAAPRSSRRR